jgi:hypothetical protein
MTRSEQFPIEGYAALCAASIILDAAMAGLCREDPVQWALAVAIRDARGGLEEALRTRRIRRGPAPDEGSGTTEADRVVSLSFLRALYPVASANLAAYSADDPAQEAALRRAIEHAAGMLERASPTRSPLPCQG